ncbi:MAG: S-adenosylmethionine:tRNA ribosyltransferase-isomerase [Bacteroidales bacterium]|nr:S-adenosylmethionine:tRNA ribosyltransferase-isomerase [Bacteroidales bacterium]
MENIPFHINIADYDYNLTDNYIAKYPLEERDKAKLLIYHKKEGKINQTLFSNLPSLLDKGSLLVFNDTKVVNARLFFEKESGAIIEIFCLEPIEPCEIQQAFSQKKQTVWKCFIGNNKRWKSGILTKKLKDFSLSAKKISETGNAFIVEFDWNNDFTFSQVLEVAGLIPLPPYIKRELRRKDEEDYQTIFATNEGSVAAPTAGLHFTDKTFDDLKNKEIYCEFLTLHVGAGTFKPVTANDISQHIMHTEKVVITKSMIENLINHFDKGITAVGTTSVRTLESLYWYGIDVINNYKPQVENNKPLKMDIKQWLPYEKNCNITTKEAFKAILSMMQNCKAETIYGKTQIIIAPPYKYRVINSMITNFHQPKSTLLLLVSAFIGEDWRKVYQYALNNNFRFLSFGDACYFSI